MGSDDVPEAAPYLKSDVLAASAEQYAIYWSACTEARKRNLKVSTAFNHMGMWWWHPLQYLVESAQGTFLTRRQLAEFNAT